MGTQFLYTPRNKRFTYRPRYWDEEKEELDNRVKRIRQEMGMLDENAPFVPHIKGQMKAGYFKKAQEAKRNSTIRLFVILLILGGLTYYLLFF